LLGERWARGAIVKATIWFQFSTLLVSQKRGPEKTTMKQRRARKKGGKQLLLQSDKKKKEGIEGEKEKRSRTGNSGCVTEPGQAITTLGGKRKREDLGRTKKKETELRAIIEWVVNTFNSRWPKRKSRKGEQGEGTPYSWSTWKGHARPAGNR